MGLGVQNAEIVHSIICRPISLTWWMTIQGHSRTKVIHFWAYRARRSALRRSSRGKKLWWADCYYEVLKMRVYTHTGLHPLPLLWSLKRWCQGHTAVRQWRHTPLSSILIGPRVNGTKARAPQPPRPRVGSTSINVGGTPTGQCAFINKIPALRSNT